MVLKGDVAPVPSAIDEKWKALSMLAHLVGDVHQPLHVGAVYLEGKSHRVNPDAGTGRQIVTAGALLAQTLQALWP